MCEAYAMETLRFQLAPLAGAYEAAYTSSGGELRLLLDTTTVAYTF
jgi:hypothetical protein